MSIMEQLADYLEGKKYVLDGIEGKFKARTWTTRYGYSTIRIDHKPTEKGKRSEAYQVIKRQLGDDFDSDVTEDERLCDIATELGFVWKGDK